MFAKPGEGNGATHVAQPVVSDGKPFDKDLFKKVRKIQEDLGKQSIAAEDNGDSKLFNALVANRASLEDTLTLLRARRG